MFHHEVKFVKKVIVTMGFKIAHSHRPPIVHRLSMEVLLLTFKATELGYKYLMEQKNFFFFKVWFELLLSIVGLG